MLLFPRGSVNLVRRGLAVLGVSFGIAIFIGVNVANDSVLSAFDAGVDAIIGAADLEVASPPSGISLSRLAEVEATPGVAAAVPQVNGLVQANDPGGDSITLIGIDLEGAPRVHRYVMEEGSFLQQAGEVVVGDSVAEANGWSTEELVSIVAGGQTHELEVAGVLAPAGQAGLLGGNVIMVELATAQALLGRGDKVDSILVDVADSGSVDQVRADLEEALGPGVAVRSPANRSEHLASLTENFRTLRQGAAFLALPAGLLVVYNLLALSVAERRREIGILRALGATRAQVSRLYLAEGLLLGGAGAFLGILIGIGLAQILTKALSETINSAFVRLTVDDVVISRQTLAIGVISSLLVSVAAAWLPARAAGRVSPKLAWGRAALDPAQGKLNRVWPPLSAGAGLIAIGVILLFEGSAAGAALAVALLFCGGALLTPALLAVLGATSYTPAFRSTTHLVWLAARGAGRYPLRSWVCVTTLMVGTALVVALGGVASSARVTLTDWLDQVAVTELIVSGAEPGVLSRDAPISEEVAATVGEVDGVASVEPFRSALLEYEDRQVLVASVPIATFKQQARLLTEDIGEEDAYAALEGGAALVSTNFAKRFDVGRGDTIELPGPDGLVRLPVAGTYLDYTTDQGTVFLDRATYRSAWQDDKVDFIKVHLADGADEDAVRRRLQSALGPGLLVSRFGEFRADALGAVDEGYNSVLAVAFLAMVMGILAIATTQVSQVIHRSHELATMRAIGATRRQIAALITLETVFLGSVGIVIGLLVGLGTLSAILNIAEDAMGMHLRFAAPVLVGALAAGLGLIACFAGAWFPVRYLTRIDLRQVLTRE